MEETKRSLQNPYRVAMLYGFAVFIVVWMVRLLWWHYLVGLRGPLGLAAIPLVCFPFLLIVFLGCIIFLLIFWRIYRTTESILSIGTVLIVFLAAFLLPVLPKPLTPEEIHFQEYRDDYKQIVVLAQSGVLSRDERGCFYLPIKYHHLSKITCLWLDNVGDNLMIEFEPFDFYHPIVYSTDGNLSGSAACDWDGLVEVQIDEHWFVCQRDWN